MTFMTTRLVCFIFTKQERPSTNSATPLSPIQERMSCSREPVKPHQSLPEQQSNHSLCNWCDAAAPNLHPSALQRTTLVSSESDLLSQEFSFCELHPKFVWATVLSVGEHLANQSLDQLLSELFEVLHPLSLLSW
mmetsp:Transcript_10253/g.38075  ORF Transcript_10253/g.38075 Transcript_10253/m.38075 type:complete len:135 (+) Transcript_10253:790-1194(+)